MSKDNGGNAFPQIERQYNPDRFEFEYVSTGGMTLRDYFAATAVAAEISRGYGNFPSALDWIVPRAYQWADAMLQERKK